MNSMPSFDVLLIRFLLVILVGGLIGAEREYRSKSAGFRTMILICLGSFLFTTFSIHISGGTNDRIASNIVTGIGFLGAGVIFKEGISVNGLTTAALIWITAAVGMAIGDHNYPLAVVVSRLVVIAVFVLEPVHRFINRLHKVKDYKIRTDDTTDDFKKEMEQFFASHDINFRCMKMNKENNDAIYLYRIGAPKHDYDIVNEFLLKHKGVKSFDI